MTDNRLEPCPFCDGKANMVIRGSNGNYDIGCSEPLCMGWCCIVGDCDCTDGYVEEEEAIKAWNTRATESELRDRVAELLGAVSHARTVGELEGLAAQYEALQELFKLHDKITTALSPEEKV